MYVPDNRAPGLPVVVVLVERDCQERRDEELRLEVAGVIEVDPEVSDLPHLDRPQEALLDPPPLLVVPRPDLPLDVLLVEPPLDRDEDAHGDADEEGGEHEDDEDDAVGGGGVAEVLETQLRLRQLGVRVRLVPWLCEVQIVVSSA